MARQTKDGVDYFPLNTNTDGDIKFQIIEARYGIVGFGIILKIYQLIYGDKGYYCEWNELVAAISASKWSCVEFPTTEKQVSKVVREAARYGIFNEEMLEKYGILTSKGIQERYFEVAKRRLKVNVKNEYLLINAPTNAENVNINSENVNINPENVYRSTQRKEKERKGNKSKVNYTVKENIKEKPIDEIEIEFNSLWKRYPNKKGKENAFKAYQKARKSGTTYNEVIQGLENYLQEIRIKRTEPNYIKHGSTWFYQQCWKDEYQLEEKAPQEDDFFNAIKKFANKPN